jgi:SH3 domain-containing YSC84-like protein 1
VIILNTQEAVNAFAKGSNVTLGGNLSAAIGPIGRSAEAGVAPQAAIYTYLQPQSRNICRHIAGGQVIASRYEANEEFYGKPVFPADILAGGVKPPLGAQKLLDVLAKY